MGCQSIVAKDICITNVMGYVKKKKKENLQITTFICIIKLGQGFGKEEECNEINLEWFTVQLNKKKKYQLDLILNFLRSD